MEKMNNITFRPVQPADKTRLLAIAAQIWEGHDYLPNIFDEWIDAVDHYFGGMELDGRLVGCGRILRFDHERVWLEGLRIDPALQKRGLGRAMVHHVLHTALAQGATKLYFSTYFKNSGSIRSSEAFGFKRVASYTNLEAELATLTTQSDVRREIATTPGLPDTTAHLWNDWLSVPPDLPDRERFFPRALTACCGASTCLMADNLKYAAEGLDICWLDAPADGFDPALVHFAIARARKLKKRFIHVMLPAGANPAPFLDAGLKFHEQACDVFLYSATADELTL